MGLIMSFNESGNIVELVYTGKSKKAEDLGPAYRYQYRESEPNPLKKLINQSMLQYTTLVNAPSAYDKTSRYPDYVKYVQELNKAIDEIFKAMPASTDELGKLSVEMKATLVEQIKALQLKVKAAFDYGDQHNPYGFQRQLPVLGSLPFLSNSGWVDSQNPFLTHVMKPLRKQICEHESDETLTAWIPLVALDRGSRLESNPVVADASSSASSSSTTASLQTSLNLSAPTPMPDASSSAPPAPPVPPPPYVPPAPPIAAPSENNPITAKWRPNNLSADDPQLLLMQAIRGGPRDKLKSVSDDPQKTKTEPTKTLTLAELAAIKRKEMKAKRSVASYTPKKDKPIETHQFDFRSLVRKNPEASSVAPASKKAKI